MSDIARYVAEVVEAIRSAPGGQGAAPARRSTVPASAPRRSTAPADSLPKLRPTPTGTALTCPRCKQGQLIAGKRGWGCSRWREGCSFVVWFESSGKRLTEAQLRDLVTKGKTRKADWAPPGGPPAPGRLLLDLTGSPESGGARFQPA